MNDTYKPKYAMNDYTANRNTYSSKVNGVLIRGTNSVKNSNHSNLTLNLPKQPFSK